MLIFIITNYPESYSSDNAPLTDLHFIYTTIINNHPGMYNEDDPEFSILLHNSFNESHQKILNSSSEEESYRIIAQFLRQFNDIHMGISFQKNDVKKHNTVTEPSQKCFAIEECAPSVYWITLPTFSPTLTEQNNLKNITSQLSSLRTNNTLIFDVRGNGGGSSEWGREIVRQLFSLPYAQNMMDLAHAHVSIDWRASKDNIEYLESIVPQIKNNFGQESTIVSGITQLLIDIHNAYEKNNSLCREHKTRALEDNIPDNPVSSSIFVIIDNRCASACLSFIDYLKAMNHPITLIGATTAADSIYMERRSVLLPSNKGSFYFPIKMYINRPRGNNVPYCPDIPYDKNLSDTTILKKDVLCML